MKTFYILTMFFIVGGEPYAETQITESQQHCQIAGIRAMQAMMATPEIEAPQFICTRARVQERGA
jgi:hypothetical protein